MRACARVGRAGWALPCLLLLRCAPPAGNFTDEAREVAAYAVERYADSTVETLAELVRFRTVKTEGIANAEHPAFRAMSAYLEHKATALGLDFEDRGAVVIIGLGVSNDRLALVTHGDVQPADPAKWAEDPFTLDVTSEPGRLIARGSEDDKGPIASALYAMKAVRDRAVPLARRIELVVSYTEESDWDPFREFLDGWTAPDLNIALDARYPVTVGEKGWTEIHLGLPPVPAAEATAPTLVWLTGGAFLSQVPEDAEAVVLRPTAELQEALELTAARDTAVAFSFRRAADSLVIAARGRAAHTSQPWEGRPAITHLAALLGASDWAPSQAATMVRLVNDLVGTGYLAERFGDLAYADEFMGPLTLTLSQMEYEQRGVLVARLNARRPVGRTAQEVERAIRQAVTGWTERTGIGVDLDMTVGDPHYSADAASVPVLLEIFRHYTGVAGEPTSIGGGTHARLLPNGVSFGPAMPDRPYTGHSEHEFIGRDQHLLNLEMYTAALVALAGTTER